MNEDRIRDRIYELARRQDVTAIVHMAAAQIKRGDDAIDVACVLIEALEEDNKRLVKAVVKMMQNSPPAPIVLQVTQEQADFAVKSIEEAKKQAGQAI